jgi:hypothetical protein
MPVGLASCAMLARAYGLSRSVGALALGAHALSGLAVVFVGARVVVFAGQVLAMCARREAAGLASGHFVSPTVVQCSVVLDDACRQESRRELARVSAQPQSSVGAWWRPAA